MKSLEEILKDIPDETKKLVEKQGDIAVYVSNLLKKKGITQREFANKLNMKESRLSKILSGQINLTLKTIVNLELALGEEIINIPFVEYKANTVGVETELSATYFIINVYKQKHYPLLPFQEKSNIKNVDVDKTLKFPPQKSKKLVAA